LIPGSTVVTQLEKNEASAEKGFFEVEIDKEVKINFRKIENSRKFFYEEMKLEGDSIRDQIEERVKNILAQNFTKLPIIKLKIAGNETDILDQDLRYIERKYDGKAIINFVKDVESPEISKKIEFLRNLKDQKLSVEEIGLNILKKNLDELSFDSSFDYDNTFKLLSDGETERTFKILVGEQKTLEKWVK